MLVCGTFIANWHFFSAPPTAVVTPDWKGHETHQVVHCLQMGPYFWSTTRKKKEKIKTVKISALNSDKEVLEWRAKQLPLYKNNGCYFHTNWGCLITGGILRLLLLDTIFLLLHLFFALYWKGNTEAKLSFPKEYLFLLTGSQSLPFALDIETNTYNSLEVQSPV